MQEDAIKTCEYEGCNLPVNKSNDIKFCIFHAPKENKGITVEEFNEKIFQEKIDKNDFNFAGYVFPGEITFPKAKDKELKDAYFRIAKFSGKTYFNEAQFSGHTNFAGAQFSGDADFVGAQFSEHTYFGGTKFSGYTYFGGAQFSGYTNFVEAQFFKDANFVEAQFSGNADFREAKFSGYANFRIAQFFGDADFREAKFSGKTYFNEAQFFKDANFVEAQFSGNADFREAKFSKAVYFINNIIQMKMSFEHISFLKDSYFYFRSPNIDPSEEMEISLNFTGIKFLPFRAYFENIEFKEGLSKVLNICFLFRYCQLEDVYFTGNDMSFFSFYKSNFDQARFVSCDWREEKDFVLKLPYKRRNILFEDFLFSNIPQKKEEENIFRKKYQINDLELREIGSLYRRMKTALDRTKDYQESGWFYFNEFETKRRELEFSPRKFIYYLFKAFSGYGEKPFWSFIWLSIFAVIFSFIHLLSGLNTSKGKINYDISLKWEAIRNIFSGEFWVNIFCGEFWVNIFSGEFWVDWLNSIIFTFYRLIPVNYMPSTDSTITPVGFHGLILALLNTLIFILMITFIVIGLKRQFRRF